MAEIQRITIILRGYDRASIQRVAREADQYHCFSLEITTNTENWCDAIADVRTMLYIATTLAPIHTAMAVAGGFTMPEGVALISTEDAGTHLTGFILYLLSHIFH